jgi:hypothetical protein
MTIPVVPEFTGPLPSRTGQTQQEFSDNVDQLFQDLPDVVDGWNDSIDAINVEIPIIQQNADNTAQASAAAVGAANYKGEWSTLTGALAIPASVSHNDSVWLLTESVADVTAVEPGVDPEWLNLLPDVPVLPEVITPTNVSPADEATEIGATPTLEGSTYFALYSVPQKSSQWQVSTDPTFATIDYDSGEVLGVGVTHVVPNGSLLADETYYWRVRYRSIFDVFSEYSTPTEFDTEAVFDPEYIATPTATPAFFGGSFEGGFYTGLIWNQVTQSATSTTIGTGSKTFTVTDAAPLFYSGQAVEIRSRANPATARMIGTVTYSQFKTLTVNVTSVDGTGTLTDWSIMAKFRIIVAPKASGEDVYAYKNANTAAPTATHTLTEGLKATLAMVAADSSTVYPAAHWANDLTINTFSDWYFPARDELELIYRNLKPMTTNNRTTADRGISPRDYKNLGSLGDTAATHGLNNHSDPQGAAYTSTVPGRTGEGIFQEGGAEAMIAGQIYFSSTEFDDSNAFRQSYQKNLNCGQQDNFGKSSGTYVRAVRRSII